MGGACRQSTIVAAAGEGAADSRLGFPTFHKSTVGVASAGPAQAYLRRASAGGDTLMRRPNKQDEEANDDTQAFLEVKDSLSWLYRELVGAFRCVCGVFSA